MPASFSYFMICRHILCQNGKAGWYEKQGSHFSSQTAVCTGVGAVGDICGDLLRGELSGGTGGLRHGPAAAHLLCGLRRGEALCHFF